MRFGMEADSQLLNLLMMRFWGKEQYGSGWLK